MEQLKGTDGQFLNFETPQCPQHIATLSIYDPRTAPGGFVRFKDLLRTFESRLERSAVFRRRLASVPLNLDQPFWIDDPDFELEYHVRHIALPKPGDWRQLCIQIARLHSRPLDRARPLWEAYVIEGVDNVDGAPPGSYALYLKVHHCSVDGMAGSELFAALHDLEPKAPEGEYGSVAKAWRPPPAPSAVQLLARASLSWLAQPWRFATFAFEAYSAWQRDRAFREEHPEAVSESKPRTRFDSPVSAHRVFGGVDVALDDVKTIRRAVPGSTVNDVAAAIVAVAARRYLLRKNELPSKPLRAVLPVSLRSAEQAKAGGNSIAVMPIDLHTTIEEPLRLLRAIRNSTAESKAARNAVGADILVRMAETMPSALQALASRAASLSARLGASAIPVNMTVSNVPGPQVPLYMAGAKVVKLCGIGVIQDGMGLFNTITSYAGTLSITFLCCRAQMPDPQDYQDDLAAAFHALFADAKRAPSEALRTEAPPRRSSDRAVLRPPAASRRT